MKDESKPPTPDSQLPTPDKTLWDELRQLDAAEKPFIYGNLVPEPIRKFTKLTDEELEDQLHFSASLLAAKVGEGTAEERLRGIYEAGRHRGFIRGCQRERRYQLQRLELRRLAIGAAVLFGVLGGFILVALMTWGLR